MSAPRPGRAPPPARPPAPRPAGVPTAPPAPPAATATLPQPGTPLPPRPSPVPLPPAAPGQVHVSVPAAPPATSAMVGQSNATVPAPKVYTQPTSTVAAPPQQPSAPTGVTAAKSAGRQPPSAPDTPVITAYSTPAPRSGKGDRKVSPAATTQSSTAPLMPVYDLSGNPLGFFPLAPGVSMPSLYPSGAPVTSAPSSRVTSPLRSRPVIPSDNSLHVPHNAPVALPIASPDRKIVHRPAKEQSNLMPHVEATPKVEVKAANGGLVAYAVDAAGSADLLRVHGPIRGHSPAPETLAQVDRELEEKDSKIKYLEGELRRSRVEASNMQENLERALDMLGTKEKQLAALQQVEAMRLRRPVILSHLSGAQLAQAHIPLSSVLDTTYQYNMLKKIPALMSLPEKGLQHLRGQATIGIVSAGALLSSTTSAFGASSVSSPTSTASDSAAVGEDLVMILDGQAKPLEGSGSKSNTTTSASIAGPGCWFGDTAVFMYTSGYPSRRACNWKAVTDVVLLQISAGFVRRCILSESMIFDRWSDADLARLTAPSYSPLQPAYRLTLRSDAAYTSLVDAARRYHALLLIAQGEHIKEAKQLDAIRTDGKRADASKAASRGWFFKDVDSGGESKLDAAKSLVPTHLIGNAAIGVWLSKAFAPGGLNVFEQLVDAVAGYFGAKACAFIELQGAIAADGSTQPHNGCNLVVRAATTLLSHFTFAQIPLRGSFEACVLSGKPARVIRKDLKAASPTAEDAAEPFMEYLGGLACISVPVYAIVGVKSVHEPAQHLVGILHVVDKMHDTRRMVARNVGSEDLDDTARLALAEVEKEGNRLHTCDDGVCQYPFTAADEDALLLVSRRIGDVISQLIRQVTNAATSMGTAVKKKEGKDVLAGKVALRRHGAEDDLSLPADTTAAQAHLHLQRMTAESMNAPLLLPISGFGDTHDKKSVAAKKEEVQSGVDSVSVRVKPLQCIHEKLQVRFRLMTCTNAATLRVHAGEDGGFSTATYIVVKCWLSCDGGAVMSDAIHSAPAHVAYGCDTGDMELLSSGAGLAVARWAIPKSAVFDRDAGAGNPWLSDIEDGQGWMDLDVKISDLALDATLMVEVCVEDEDEQLSPPIYEGGLSLFENASYLKVGRQHVPLSVSIPSSLIHGGDLQQERVGSLLVDVGSVGIEAGTAVVDCALLRPYGHCLSAVNITHQLFSSEHTLLSALSDASRGRLDLRRGIGANYVSRRLTSRMGGDFSSHAYIPTLRHHHTRLPMKHAFRHAVDVATARADLTRLDSALFDALMQGNAVGDVKSPQRLSHSLACVIWDSREAIVDICGTCILPLVWRAAVTSQAAKHREDIAVAFVQFARRYAPLPASVCVKLLGEGVTSPIVRCAAVAFLSQQSFSDLLQHLPTLIGCLAFETHLDNPLARYILMCCAESVDAAKAVAWWMRYFVHVSPIYSKLLQAVLDVSHELFTPELALQVYSVTQVALCIQKCAMFSPESRNTRFRKLLSTASMTRVFQLPFSPHIPFLPSLYYQMLQSGRLAEIIMLWLDGGRKPFALQRLKKRQGEVEDIDAVNPYEEALLQLQELEDALSFGLSALGIFSDAVALALPVSSSQDYSTLVSLARAAEENAARLSEVEVRVPQAASEEFWTCSYGSDAAAWLDSSLPYPAALLRAARDSAAAKPAKFTHPRHELLTKTFLSLKHTLTELVKTVNGDERADVEHFLRSTPANFVPPQPPGVSFPATQIEMSDVLTEQCRILHEDRRRRVCRAFMSVHVSNDSHLEHLHTAHRYRGETMFGADPFPEVVKVRQLGSRPIRLRDNTLSFIATVEDPVAVLIEHKHAAAVNHMAHTWRMCGLEMGDFVLPYITGVHNATARDPLTFGSVVSAALNDESSCGGRTMYLQVCPSTAKTLAEIVGPDVTAFGRNGLQRWLMSTIFSEANVSVSDKMQSEDYTAYDVVVKSFSYSLAGLLAISYVLALGPLESAAVLVAPSGHIMLSSLGFSNGAPDPALSHDLMDPSAFMMNLTVHSDASTLLGMAKFTEAPIAAELLGVLGIHHPLTGDAATLLDSLIGKAVDGCLALRDNIEEISFALHEGSPVRLPGIGTAHAVSCLRSRLFLHLSAEAARSNLHRVLKRFLNFEADDLLHEDYVPEIPTSATRSKASKSTTNTPSQHKGSPATSQLQGRTPQSQAWLLQPPRIEDAGGIVLSVPPLR